VCGCLSAGAWVSGKADLYQIPGFLPPALSPPPRPPLLPPPLRIEQIAGHFSAPDPLPPLPDFLPDLFFLVQIVTFDQVLGPPRRALTPTPYKNQYKCLKIVLNVCKLVAKWITRVAY
jgi:hypothetical protein